MWTVECSEYTQAYARHVCELALSRTHALPYTHVPLRHNPQFQELSSIPNIDIWVSKKVFLKALHLVFTPRPKDLSNPERGI